MTDTSKPELPDYLIRKGGYFYRPKRAGYTTSKGEAGRYTKAEAEREAAIEPWHMSAVHQDEVPDEPNYSLDTMREKLSSAKAEIERLREQLAFSDKQAEKLEMLVEPHVAWDGQPSVIERLQTALETIRKQTQKRDDLRDVLNFGLLANVEEIAAEALSNTTPSPDPKDAVIAEQWQPIKTAPKTGERLLLFVPPYGAMSGHWAETLSPMTDDSRWVCHSCLNKNAQPTHWMPLAGPPALAKQGGSNG